MTRTIAISDDAYDWLHEMKEENESFTKVILKFAEKERRKPLLDFFGKWPGPKSELDRIKKELEKDRKQFKTRNVRFT